MNTFLDTVLERGPDVRRGALAVLVVGVPVMFLRVTLDPYNVPKLGLLGLGVAFVAALRIAETILGRDWRGLKLIAVPAALMAAPLLLSWALSPYRSWATFGYQGRFQGLVPYLLAILLGVFIADAFRGRVGQLALLVCWAGGVVGGYALLQRLGLDPFEWNLFGAGAPNDAISTTGNPNFTGGFLGIALPIALALATTDPGRRRVVVRLSILIFAGWVVARSQGGWAAGIAGSAIVGGYLLGGRHRLARAAGFSVALIVALATVGSVLIAFVKPDSRFVLETARVRSHWWAAATDMGISHPLAGRGPNSFTIEGASHRSIEDAIEFNFDFPDDPHSVPLSMFANLGVLGLLGFVGVLVWALYFFWRSADPTPLEVAFLAGAVAYFVQSMVSIDEITLRSTLWMCLGGLGATVVADEVTAPARKSKKAISKSRSRSHAAPLAVGARGLLALGLSALLLVGAAYWTGTFLLADAKVREGTNAFASRDIDLARTSFDSALSLRDAVDYRGILALDLFHAAKDDEGRFDPDLVEAAERAFGYTDEVPYVFGFVSHARLLSEAAGDAGSERSADLYLEAIDRDPLNPLLRTEAALELEKLGRAEEGLALLLVLKDDVGNHYETYWGALALCAVRTGDDELAQEAVDIALALSPGEANANRAQAFLQGKRF